MNERIQELIKQATEIKEYKEYGAAISVLNAEKFAELIIKDIDDIVDNLYHAMPLEQAVVLLTLDENIKEHFYGVES